MSKQHRVVKRNEQPLSVVLIDANNGRLSLLNRALQEYDCQVIAKLEDTLKLQDNLSRHQPDILVVGYDRADLSSLQDIAQALKKSPLPVVVFAEQETPQAITFAIKAGVSAFVVDDIQPHRLKSILQVSIARFNEQQRLQNELTKAKNQLADRKIVEKAKGLLMQSQTLSEEFAYKRMRNTAMDKGISITQVASNIIDVFELLNEN